MGKGDNVIETIIGLCQPVKPGKRFSINGDRSGCFFIHTIAILIANYIIKSLIYKGIILTTISN